MNKGKVYFFVNDIYYRYDIAKRKVDSGYPKNTRRAWTGISFPSVDAVLNYNNGKAYFFHGNQYIRYDVKNKKADGGYPKLTAQAWSGVNFPKIDAVLNYNNGKVYFFHGSQYIRYDVKNKKADSGYPKNTRQVWKGVPFSRLDAVLNYNQGKVYFFKGTEYVRFDIFARKVDPGYPKNIAKAWTGLVPNIGAAINYNDPRSWSRTSFQPHCHGFKFVNSFSVNNPVSDGKLHFGFCGGMSLAAKRRHKNNRSIPSTTSPPSGGALYSELWDAQLDTILPQRWLKFYEWQCKPDKPGMTKPHTIGYSTKREFSKLRSRIRANKPIILGLVRQKGSTASWSKNHQVLAIGYAYHSANKVMRVYVYDPNFPRETSWLDIDYHYKDNKITIKQRGYGGSKYKTVNSNRGFFLIDVN